MWSIFGAITGYFLFRFDGAIAGFLLGTIVDRYLASQYGGKKGSGGNTQSSPLNDILNTYTGDFNFILVSLTAAVMRSDGQTTRPGTGLCERLFCEAVWCGENQTGFTHASRSVEE